MSIDAGQSGGMTEVLAILGPVYLIIATGWLFGQRKFAGNRSTTATVLNSFVYYLAMPAFLFAVTSSSHIPIRIPFILSYASAMLITAVIAAISAHTLYNRRGREVILCVMLAVHSNSAYVGLPVMQLAYGDVTSVINISLFQIAIVTPIILVSLEGNFRIPNSCPTSVGMCRNTLSGVVTIVKLIIRNPIIVATLGGFAVSSSGIPVPKIAAQYVELLGQGALPVALIVLGLSLTRPEGRLTSMQEVGFIAVCSLLLLPTFAYIFGRYVFTLESVLVRDVTLMAAMPASMNALIFAKRFDVFVSQTALIVTVTLLGSALSVAILLLLLGWSGVP